MTVSDISIEPMRLHKNLVIAVLKNHPEDLPQIFGDKFATAEEAIEALQADPHEWFVGNELTE